MPFPLNRPFTVYLLCDFVSFFIIFFLFISCSHHNYFIYSAIVVENPFRIGVQFNSLKKTSNYIFEKESKIFVNYDFLPRWNEWIELWSSGLSLRSFNTHTPHVAFDAFGLFSNKRTSNTCTSFKFKKGMPNDLLWMVHNRIRVSA